MSKHTPGPWVYQRGLSPSAELKEGHTRFWVETHDGIHAICGIRALETASGHFTIKEHEANARLIAAAPEMLEIVRRLANWSGGNPIDGDSPRGSIFELATDAARLWAKMQKEAGDGE